MPLINRENLPYFIALAAGLLVALISRFVFASNWFQEADGLLMLCFLVLTPLALGGVTAHFTPASASVGSRIFLAPAATVLLFLVTAMLFQLEGLICVLMISPLFMLVSWIGAALYVVFTKNRSDKGKTYALAAFALFTTPTELRRVENAVVIEAPAAVVWQQIIRVRPIAAQDLGPSVVDKIGFPRPVEATLTHEGVGGVRHATFERGVEFIETVDLWEPQRRLSFSIVPNTATIPPTTFDEHVTVGGRFFDVLRGTYELEPAGPGRTRLILYSQQRLSTRVNPYAGLWTSFIMSEIQRRILEVIRRRCEVEARS